MEELGASRAGLSISAALIVRDEAACLRRCLESLEGVADEIVVVDTGSKDDTVAIARSYTGQVFFSPWRDDFSVARNVSLDHARGVYVLVIDADTEIENRAEARGLLERFMRANDGCVAGTADIFSPQAARPDANVTLSSLQVCFRRGVFRYTGAVHEQLVLESGELHSTARTGLRYLHGGYALDRADAERKSRRNMRILERELAERPGDTYYLYQMGKACFSLGNHRGAIPYFEQALAGIRFAPGEPAFDAAGRPVAEETLTDLVVSAAYAYMNDGRPDDAFRLLDAHGNVASAVVRRADFWHAMGYVLLMRGDVAGAKAAYTESLARGPLTELVQGAGSYSSHYHLGLLSEAENGILEALNHYARALAANPCHAPAIGRCLDMIVEYGICADDALWRLADAGVLARIYAEKIENLDRGANANKARLLRDTAAAIGQRLGSPCDRNPNNEHEKET